MIHSIFAASLLALSTNAAASELITFEEVALDPDRGIYFAEVRNIGAVEFDNQICGSRCIDGIGVQNMATTYTSIHLWGSGPQVGTISNGTSMSILGGGLFDLESAHMGVSHPFSYEPSATWVIANGYAKGSLLYSTQISLGQTASLVDFGWKGIDRLSFDTRINGGHVVIDDISLSIPSSVPEPETYALMLAGLGMMGGIARRRKAMIS